ncbi:sensor histidine kinase [Pseudomonas aegrilactucae]|uniref:histidine kinase n=1 Tax=Pseudomonas aegrilactucae TaxID=2854028 RepID=A0A9Q3AFW3_9PSED|nr:sensor histidine kinase [Pseudomonas aegrilactucae]MBV6289293.1 sensor histidine kinase [Pseudomonas aegrilactucae]
MKLPGRHSLLWKLCGLLVVLCLLILWVSRSGGAHFERQSYHLSQEAQQVLKAYAAQAHVAWREGGTQGVDRWLAQLHAREVGWALVVGPDLRSLSSQPLSEAQQRHVTFMRQLHWPMSKRAVELPAISVPFPDAPHEGKLVIQLPERFMPSIRPLLVQLLTHGVLPGVLALFAGLLLYRVLIGPLAHLRAQANALRADRLSTRVDPVITRRQDELGDLGRAFDHMAERLEKTVALQHRLLADLSHELRTPLTRLHMAAENEADTDVLRERLTREVQCMRQLVDDTLELVWLDTERPKLALDTVEVQTLWDVVRENACFESGWHEQQLPNELGEDCLVHGHLNGLAQAMENIVRNAIRHSPAQGQVRLGGCRDGAYWHLWIDDQGPGVAEDALESIFQPFTRLDAARPGGDGFGLGLTIARCRVQLQGGQLWAQNLNPGLRLNLRLPAADGDYR